MKKFGIVSDSSCDLAQEYTEKEKVTMEDAKKMNLLLAERFGVRSYEIVFTKPSSCSDHRHEMSFSPE